MAVMRLLTAATCGFVLIGATDAHAKEQWRKIGTAQSAAFGDSGRYAAWQSGPRRITAFDSITSRRRHIDTPAGYTLVAVGGGDALLTTDPAPTPSATDPPTAQVPQVQLLDLRRFTRRSPVGYDQFAGTASCGDTGGMVTFFAIGRFGIAGRCDSRGPELVWLNWRTGDFSFPNRDASINGDVVGDVNSPTLTTKLCSPLRRVRDPEPLLLPVDTYVPFPYERPYGLRYGPRIADSDNYRGLRLLGCGEHASRRLDRGNVTAAQVSGDRAAWLRITRVGRSTRTSAAQLMIYDPRRKRRVLWPRAVFESVPPVLALTRSHVLLSTKAPGAANRRVVRISRR